MTQTKQELLPHPRVVGEFTEAKHKHSDGIGFLAPLNWIWHDSIVEKVLTGDYNNIPPVCAEFDATLNCSNRCNICGYDLVKKLEGTWIRNNFKDPEAHMQSFGLAQDLLDKLIDSGIKGLIFTGGGEPFMFQGLEDLIAHATFRKADSAVYTNGNYLTEKRTRKLVCLF